MSGAHATGASDPTDLPLPLLPIASVTAAATLILAVATTRDAVPSLDEALERAVGRVRARLRPAARVGTLPGEPWAHWSIGAAIALTIIARRGHARRALLPMVGASLGAITAHHAVKMAYRRPRPRLALRRGKTEPAFPSGHTIDATAVLAAGAYLLVREGLAPAHAAVPVAATLALGTGASRVALGWHWGSDVVGGWLAGISVASVCAHGYELLRRRARCTPRIAACPAHSATTLRNSPCGDDT